MLTKLSKPELLLLHTCTGIGLYKGPLTEPVLTNWMATLINLKGQCREKIWVYCDADNVLGWLERESTKCR
jgi:hypothetical protein